MKKKNQPTFDCSRRVFLKSSTYGIGGLGVLSSPGFTFSADAVANNFALVNHDVFGQENGDCPGIASDGQGNIWTVYLRRLCKGGQQVVIQHSRDQSPPVAIFTTDIGSYETPVIACGNGGHPFVVWSRENGDAWSLEGVQITGNRVQKPVCVVDGPGRAANPRLAVDRSGDCWLVWESFSKGVFTVCLKRCHNGQWGKVVLITEGKHNASSPAVAAGSDGKIWVAYRQAEPSDCVDYTIKIRAYDCDSDRLDDAVDVAAGSRWSKGMSNLNNHPDIAFDREDRLWIAWETRDSDTRACWFGRQACQVACYSEGKIQEISGDHNGSFSRENDRFPTFARDGLGQLWIFTRNIERGDVVVDGIRLRKWKMRATVLGPNGWSRPITIFDSMPSLLGRGHRVALTAEGKNAFRIFWQSDNYPHVLPEDYEYQLHAAQLRLPPGDPSEFKFSLQPRQVVQRRSLNANCVGGGRPIIKKDGQEYTLLFGNLHEHTNMSRCSLGDGMIDEEYHYGRDIEGYDFLGLTDHDYNYDREKWEKSLRAVRFYNDDPFFVAMPALEWTASREDRTGWPEPGSGHRNIIFASSNEAKEFINEENDAVYHCNHPKSDQIGKVWDILEKKQLRAITIPHHPADPKHPVDWDSVNSKIESVVEIYQLRGSYEYRDCPLQDRPEKVSRHDGLFIQDALARGHRLGFIASGDHNSMGLGTAALWVKEVSQEGIYEALQARRCYATSGDKIFLDFRVNEHLTGEELTAQNPPRITVHIRATAPISNIVVFKNNEVVYEQTGDQMSGGKEAQFEYVDQDFFDSSYYYLRVIQENGQVAWGSPVWVNMA